MKIYAYSAVGGINTLKYPELVERLTEMGKAALVQYAEQDGVTLVGEVTELRLFFRYDFEAEDAIQECPEAEATHVRFTWEQTAEGVSVYNNSELG